MTTTPTLVEMAREIERRKPGALPKSARTEDTTLWTDCAFDGALSIMLPDDLAHAILRDAMVMATGARRHMDCWTVPVVPQEDQPWEDLRTFLDSDHGDCPTRSLFAAFCAAFPEPKETPDA